MKKALIIAAVLVMLAIAAVPLSDADGGETATIDGYVMISGKFVKNNDIVIAFYESDVNFVRTVGIDEDGHFSIEVPGNVSSSDCQISFTLKGYSVSTLPSTISGAYEKVGSEIRYYLSESFAGGTIAAGGTYSLCMKDVRAVSMNSSSGSIQGSVLTNSEKPIGVNDVKVTLMDGNTVKTVVTTSRGGKFSIDDCPTGTYELVFSAPGYKSVTKEVTVEEGVTETVNVTIEKDTIANGLTFIQITMIVCGSIAALLIVIAIIGFVMNRSGKHFIIYKKN